jgi:hypothetical protein
MVVPLEKVSSLIVRSRIKVHDHIETTALQFNLLFPGHLFLGTFWRTQRRRRFLGTLFPVTPPFGVTGVRNATLRKYEMISTE